MHTCGEFANQYMKNIYTEQVYFAWTQGYITALNSMRLVQDKPILNLQPSSFDPASLNDLEREFTERMQGVVLVGHFTIEGLEDQGGNPERYEIARVNPQAAVSKLG